MKLNSNVINISIASSNLSSRINVIGSANLATCSKNINTSDLKTTLLFKGFEVRDIDIIVMEGEYPDF